MSADQEHQPHADDPAAAAVPTLYVCDGDDSGPKIHPCKRVQEALRAAGIEYRRVVGGGGHPIPFLRRGSREVVRQATGDVKLPALVLGDGTVITHSKAILRWVAAQR
jgi:glutathione S-transferase